MKPDKHIYFASDFHLGAPTEQASKKRELKIIAWLDSIKTNCEELFLMGDLFDFWFEYKHVVPKGYIRFLAKLCEFTDQGIPVHVFTGNHDMWMFDYLEKEIGVTIHRTCIERTFNHKTFFLGHGDGLGPGDYGYKFIKKIFANRFCQWLFARIHPNLAFRIANFWSLKSRNQGSEKDKEFLGEDHEWLAIFAKEKLTERHLSLIHI